MAQGDVTRTAIAQELHRLANAERQLDKPAGSRDLLKFGRDASGLPCLLVSVVSSAEVASHDSNCPQATQTAHDGGLSGL